MRKSFSLKCLLTTWESPSMDMSLFGCKLWYAFLRRQLNYVIIIF